jgi:hypothetical protein
MRYAPYLGFKGLKTKSFRLRVPPRGKTPENTFTLIKKYNEIPKTFGKYLEISGNTTKYQKNKTKNGKF